MKLTIYSMRLPLLIALLSAGVSCTRNFDELNTDPSLVTKEVINPSILFTSVLKNSIFASYNASLISEYSGYYANTSSGIILQDRNWIEPLSSFYRSYLINTAEVIRLTEGSPRLINEHAIARIWKVWLFHQVTDAYGDIPYSDAVKDVSDNGNQPVYDAQETIYKDMLNELKEAEQELSVEPSLASFGSADILFSGNVDSWKRLANSLRLRLAIRVRYADPTLAQQHIAEVINAPLIEENAQNAQLLTLGENTPDMNNRNPLYNRMIELSGEIMDASLTTTENLKRLNDPRLPVFVDPAVDGVSGFKGRPLAIFGDEKLPYTDAQTATLSMSFQSAEYAIIVFNAAETFFLKAEAGLANLGAADAQEMFAKGIQTSLEQYHIGASAITDYLGSAAGTLTGTEEEKLEQIIIQKWLAIYYESAEGWAEFRRTGYPRIWTGSDKGNTDGNIPRRLTYPQEEYSKNEDHVREAAARINGDKLLSRIWWDKKDGLPKPHPRQGMFPPEP